MLTSTKQFWTFTIQIVRDYVEMMGFEPNEVVHFTERVWNNILSTMEIKKQDLFCGLPKKSEFR